MDVRAGEKSSKGNIENQETAASWELKKKKLKYPGSDHHATFSKVKIPKSSGSNDLTVSAGKMVSVNL